MLKAEPVAARSGPDHRPRWSASPARSAVVADADTDTRDLYRTALQAEGYDVYEAEDGRDALTKLYAYRPGVLVTDARLAYIDAAELCRLLRSDRNAWPLRITVITAEATTAVTHRMRAAGADSILCKPFPLESLLVEPDRPALPVEPDPSSSIDASLTRVQARSRFVTRTPPAAPPALLCPICDVALQYDRTHVGGVSDRHPEQWDYFVCGRCGPFQYRHRTRKLRRVT